MLTPDIMRRIRRIELQTRKLVNTSFAGAYHSVFKGRGLVFDSVRPYQPGDAIRDIDWNVTARTGEAFIKNYTEERELTVLLALDTSASCLFGTVTRQKRDLAAELGAVLALAAISNNDKVGLLIFSDKIELFIAPRKGRNHVLRLIRELLAARPASKGTDLALALHAINRLIKQRAIVFLLSDFLATRQEYGSELLVTGRRHDLIAVVLSDPREQSWPDVGMVALQDAETGSVRWIDTASKKWRTQFEKQTQRFHQMRDAILTHAGVDRIDLPVDGDYVGVLTQFFQRRAHRVR